MDAKELRAAAERLLDDETGVEVTDCGDYIDGGYALTDALHLARAYLAEHPADDGEPVDVEMVERSLPDADTTVAVLGGVTWVTAEFMIRSRGDLRRLCDALGIPLKAGA